ncbi:hypothetical protein [Vibrio marisflavi]|uniref:Uncharacterized protein n=1 Tax=Vibrio marisflavi CECT 7928 TaxID=634439 RepID=A0ABM9A3W4_9VIBR|nr:hypothetical protein [Vibrio marisflavi]CAH0539514.1 hypothetical protein VMF7928_02210 [Vibrio marisflavi CECT 7928]
MLQINYRDIDLQQLYAHIGWLKNKGEHYVAELEVKGKKLTLKTIPELDEGYLKEEHSQFSQTLSMNTYTSFPVLSTATDLQKNVESIVEELVSNLNDALLSKMGSPMS